MDTFRVLVGSSLQNYSTHTFTWKVEVVTGQARLDHKTYLTGTHLTRAGAVVGRRLGRVRLLHLAVYAKDGIERDQAKQGWGT